MVLRREVGGRLMAPITLTVFGMGAQPTQSSINEDLNFESANSTIPIQVPLNSIGAARLHPEYVPGNPFLACPKTTNQDTYKYKMYNKEEQRGQMNVNKQHHIRKNEIKAYKNAQLCAYKTPAEDLEKERKRV